MGKASRDKGSRGERLIVSALAEIGIRADKRSGMYVAGHDLDVFLSDTPVPGEVKLRATGFKFLYDTLPPGGLLFLKADRKRPLVVMDLDMLAAVRGKG